MSAPYAVGDHVQALSAGTGGTCLITGRVVRVAPSGDDAYPWTITYTDPFKSAGVRSVKVDQRGQDRNRYVERTLGLLPWQATAAHGLNMLHQAAHAARAAGVVGGLLRSADDHGVALAFAWPSGHDRYVVDVPSGTVLHYRLRFYTDGASEPHRTATVPSAADVAAALAEQYEADAGGYDAVCQAAADAQGITAIVAALQAHGIAADVWQTGGYCMAATVKIPGTPDLIVLTDETAVGEPVAIVAAEYTPEEWDGQADKDYDDPARDICAPLAQAVEWVADRLHIRAIADAPDAHPDEFIHADERPIEAADIAGVRL